VPKSASVSPSRLLAHLRCCKFLTSSKSQWPAISQSSVRLPELFSSAFILFGWRTANCALQASVSSCCTSSSLAQVPNACSTWGFCSYFWSLSKWFTLWSAQHKSRQIAIAFAIYEHREKLDRIWWSFWWNSVSFPSRYNFNNLATLLFAPSLYFGETPIKLPRSNPESLFSLFLDLWVCSRRDILRKTSSQYRVYIIQC